jgi:hypothetical protein
MAIDFIPSRFYTSASEDSTLVSRAFVPNCVTDSKLEETFTEDSESANARSEIGAPTSPRSLDGNNNTLKTRLSFGRNGRLTSDDVVTEQNDLRGGLKTSCEHLSHMVAAETDLETFGFCNPSILTGLVPERFLPSLVEFNDKCPRSKNTPDILQHSPTFTDSTPPDIGELLRQFAARAGLKLQKEKGLETSVQALESETDGKRRESKIVMCSNCGCYNWAE